MGQQLIEAIEDWSEGVITSARPDELPPNASPRGWNSAFYSVAPGKSVVGTRKGIATLNATAITSNPAIIGQYHFQPRDATTGVLGSIHLLLTDTGRLERLNSDTTLTNLSTSFDSISPLAPDFETANNLCFIANGTDSFKVTSTPAVQTFGIAAPSAPTAVATGVGGMTGDYEVALTYLNSATGHESSRSPATTVTLAAQQLRVTIPNAADTQVDFVRIHIRKGTLSAYFFRVVSGTGINTTQQAWADNYGTVDLNLSDNDLNDLIILSPDEDENDPPPTSLRYLCWHGTRMFGSDGKHLFYSKLGLPEAWDPEFEEPINEDDGQTITGLHSMGGVLLIFKTRSVYGLFGDDPNSWYLRQLDADTGCTSHRSILTIESKTYWWSLRGPMQLAGEAGRAPDAIGFELLQPTIATDALAYDQFGNVVAAADYANQRVIFAVASTGATRNDTLLPFSYRLQRWEASKWDPMDVASFGQLLDSTNQPYVSLGSYQGQCFRMDSGTNDGVPSGTTTGTFVASGTSVSTITDAGAAFNTTGGALRERKVTLVDSNGAWIGRGRISSNTATALTLAAAISGLTNGATYTYYIGGPDFQWDSAWRDFDAPFHKKRLEYLFLQGLAASSTTLHLDLAFDWNPNYGQSKTLSLAGSSSTWDATVWTHASYATKTVAHHRVRVGRTGRVWKVRVRLHIPDKPMTLLKLGVQAERMTTKS